ncbi:HD domain-containing protein [Planococcus sp. YIM B11945]|uniref:HD domain-containing protein n=1 Tax=Planococcus sp. YIM B11945 TaxID=3435410 RepID=UPI003D7DBF31
MNKLIDKALQFAAVKHHGQMRKGTNIPYITHPVAVALMLQKEKQRDEVVAAGLLHDTLEDTEATESELEALFGLDVLNLVKAATEPDKSLPWEERKLHTVSRLSFRSTEELHLIIADKWHNLQSIKNDVDRLGESVWSRFNRGKREQSWYYMGIAHALKARKKEVPLVREFERDVFQLFVGVDKLAEADIELLFRCAFLIDPFDRQELKHRGLERFAEEIKASSRALVKKEDYESIKPLWNFLHLKGVEFEWTAEGPFIILTFLQELKDRLAWSDEQLYKQYVKHHNKL